MVWPGSRAGLNPAQLPFVQHIDGCRSIREIVQCVVQQHGVPDARVAELDKFARTLFQSLWRVDFVAITLNADSQEVSRDS